MPMYSQDLEILYERLQSYETAVWLNENVRQWTTKKLQTWKAEINGLDESLQHPGLRQSRASYGSLLYEPVLHDLVEDLLHEISKLAEYCISSYLSFGTEVAQTIKPIVTKTEKKSDDELQLLLKPPRKDLKSDLIEDSARTSKVRFHLDEIQTITTEASSNDIQIEEAEVKDLPNDSLGWSLKNLDNEINSCFRQLSNFVKEPDRVLANRFFDFGKLPLVPDLRKEPKLEPANRPFDPDYIPDSRGRFNNFILWNRSLALLYYRIAHRASENRLPASVSIVIRHYLTDPARLTKIQRRLVDANMRRRYFFDYCKTLPLPPAQNPRITKGSITVSNPKSATAAASSRTTFSSDNFSLVLGNAATRSVTTTAISSISHTVPASNYPNPPAGHITDSDESLPRTYTCPLCGLPLPEDMATRPTLWRRHVNEDILPYTCIFEECSQPDTMYRTISEWLMHMETEHSGREWVCYSCSPSEPLVFQTEKEYIDHFRVTRQHLSLYVESELPNLAKLNMMPRPLNFTTCPLCRWSEQPEEDHGFLGRTMQDHIAQHIHAFALYSLVDLPGVENKDSDFQTDRMSASDRSVSDSSLSRMDGFIYDLESEDRLDDVSAWALNADLHSSSPIGPMEPPELVYDIDWSFISRKFDDELPDDFVQSWTKSTFKGVPEPLESTSSHILCEYCKAIDHFFKHFDPNITTQQFPFYKNRTELFLSARWCQFCGVLVDALQAKESYHPDLAEFGTDDESYEKSEFAISFEGIVDKKLRLFETGDAGQQLFCEFELYCSRDDRLVQHLRDDWTGYRTMFNDVASAESLDFMRSHLQTCLSSHPRCQTDHGRRPTRLIDLKTGTYSLRDSVKLSQNRGNLEQVEYAFLSACWGSGPAIRLLQSNFAAFTENIFLDELPKSIRDAIFIARGIGISFIWVDSLCIMQDSVEDWRTEAGRQSNYLLNSTVTIAAAGAPSLADGFLNPKADRSCFTFSVETPAMLKGSQIRLRNVLPSAWEALSGDPLLSRLWAFQELTLSPRVLYFGSSRFVWSCRTMSESDDSVTSRPAIWAERLGFESFWGPSSAEEIYNTWQRVVSYSSRLRLTFEGDRLPALSALASIAASNLGNDKYLAGLWRGNLARDLLWHRAKDFLQKKSYSAPSWSWASYMGEIIFELEETGSLHKRLSSLSEHATLEARPELQTPSSTLSQSEPVFFRPLVKLMDVVSILKGHDPFGEVESCILSLFAFCISYDKMKKMQSELLLKIEILEDEREDEDLSSHDQSKMEYLFIAEGGEALHALLVDRGAEKGAVRKGVAMVRVQAQPSGDRDWLGNWLKIEGSKKIIVLV